MIHQRTKTYLRRGLIFLMILKILFAITTAKRTVLVFMTKITLFLEMFAHELSYE